MFHPHLSTRELLAELLRIEDEIRCTPSHVTGLDEVATLNPDLGRLALRELDVLRALRRRRESLDRLSVVPSQRSARVR